MQTARWVFGGLALGVAGGFLSALLRPVRTRRTPPTASIVVPASFVRTGEAKEV